MKVYLDQNSAISKLFVELNGSRTITIYNMNDDNKYLDGAAIKVHSKATLNFALKRILSIVVGILHRWR